MKPYAPLGLLYVSSHLKRKGFDVRTYDSTFGSREELFRILHDGPPSVVGVNRFAEDCVYRREGDGVNENRDDHPSCS